MSRFLRDPVSIRGAVRVIVVATFTVVVASGVAMRVLDHREYPNVFKGMWWALQTVTTVGYGDVTPTRVSGRLVASIVMFVGIALLAIVTAAVTSTFVERAQQAQQSLVDAREAEVEHRAEARFDALEARLEQIDARLQALTASLAREPGGPPGARG
jgi:voltage-gated potassium channel